MSLLLAVSPVAAKSQAKSQAKFESKPKRVNVAAPTPRPSSGVAQNPARAAEPAMDLSQALPAKAMAKLPSSAQQLKSLSSELKQGQPQLASAKEKSDSLAAEAAGRMVEHLKVHEVDFAKTPLTLGAPLTLKAGKEQFTGEFSKPANKLLTRNYRKPFVVPKLA